MPIPQPLPQLLPINAGGGCSVKDLFFSPLRFCGRQWMWIEGDNNNQIVHIALKVLAVPFLTCATALSCLPAVIGALVFSEGYIPSITEYSPGGGQDLLRKSEGNEAVARIVKDRLRSAGYECSVEVRSQNRRVNNNNFPDHIHRYVTLINPSSTKITRFFEVIKGHFCNTDVPSLSSAYPCIYRDNMEENLPHLKRILALHEAVTVSMACDLAYVRTELGRRSR